MDYWDFRQFRKVREEIADAGDQIDSVRDGAAQSAAVLERQLQALSLSFNALVELLVEDGKLSIDDLRARVNAAAIAAEHERRERSDPAQDVWDSAKPR